MALHLGFVLNQLSIKQVTLAKKLTGSLSASSISRIINYNQWPKNCDVTKTKTQIKSYLQKQGASSELLRGLFKQQLAVKKNNESTNETEELEIEMLTMATREFFNLKRDPFQNEIQTVHDVFLTRHNRMLLEEMNTAAHAGSMIALIGECGSGKTILRRLFIEQMRTKNPDLIIIEPRRLDRKKITAEGISQAICRALELKNGGMSSEQRDAMIEDALVESAGIGKQHILIIDEAHDLPTSVIKLIKRIWELTAGFSRVMGVVLIGQTELKKILQGSYVREFAWRCNQLTVQPLGRDLPDYVAHKFKSVGIDASTIFTVDAIHAIRGKCAGRTQMGLNSHQPDMPTDLSYPLSINSWLARVMNAAAHIGETKITEKLVHKV
ncbi:MAG: hypothetical protein COB35_04890 [Gammaproteobacteria bacterium]|nr:MAG: hypothetical protein COB35_04890 [Gammaproteobacteria bacterium]